MKRLSFLGILLFSMGLTGPCLAQTTGDEQAIDNWQTRHEKAVGDKKTIVVDKEKSVKEVKSPVRSFLLSAILPGLGQYYNGTTPEIIKGGIQTVGFFTGLILYVQAKDAQNTLGHGDYYYFGQALGGLSLFVSAYVWSVFDARISADDINREDSKGNAATDLKMHIALLNDSAFQMVPVADISLRF